MKRLSIFFLCFPLLWSCSKDGELSPEEREKRDTYRFYEIQYRIDPSAGDGMVEKSRELPAEVIVNRTFSTLTDTVRTPNDQFEYSGFRADSIPDYTLEIDEDAVIKLPESLFFASTGSIWFRTEKQGFAPDADYSFPYTSSQSFSAGTIPPYCMRTAIHTVRYNETTVSYTALFVGRETGKTLEITGRCVSTDIVGIDSSVVLSEIE